MKKTITFLVLMLLSTTLFSQDKLDYTTYEYDDGAGGWAFYDKSEYLYDTDNNLVEQTYLSWSDGVWEDYFKVVYTYDTSNNNTGLLGYQWDIGTAQWVVIYRVTITYNANNDFIFILEEYWEDGQWKNDDKLEITYYAAGKINQYTSYEWSNTGGVWDIEGRGTATYNATMQLTSMLDEYWTGTAWENDEKTLFTYNADDKITQKLYQEWEDAVWITDSKTVYDLDTNSNRLLLTYYHDLGSGLEASYKEEYNYDMTKLQSNTAHPFNVDFYFLEDFPYFNRSLGQIDSSYYEGVWNNETRVTHHYTNTSGVSDENLMGVSIYPNPTAGKLFVQLENTAIQSISIFDITGKLVQEDISLSQDKSIDLSLLETGVYIVEVLNNKGDYQKKNNQRTSFKIIKML